MNRILPKASKVGLVAAVLGFISLIGSEPASAYTSRELPPLSGGDASYAYAINENGQVTGKANVPVASFFNSLRDRAVIWQPSGTITNLGTLYNGYPNPSQSIGNAINNIGHVAGWANDSQGSYPPAFYWDGTTLSGLPRISTDGGPTAIAYGIRELTLSGSQQAVGYADFYDPKVAGMPFARAYLWTRDPGTKAITGTLLPTFFGRSVAYDINNSGQIVGCSNDSTNTQHAVLWSGSNGNTMTDYGVGGVASAINDYGVVVGDLNGQVCVWPNGPTPQLLGPAGSREEGVFGATGGRAVDNRPGAYKVVGSSSVYESNGGFNMPAGNYNHAFLWSSDGSVIDLAYATNVQGSPTYGYRLYEATGINNAGQIVCNGVGILYTNSGKKRAFVLTP